MRAHLIVLVLVRNVLFDAAFDLSELFELERFGYISPRHLLLLLYLVLLLLL